MTLALQKQKKSFSQIRIQKIHDYAKKYSKRTDTEKEADFEDVNERQENWGKRRIVGPVWTWQRCDGIDEVWTPWNRFGEPVNQWRRYYKSQ